MGSHIIIPAFLFNSGAATTLMGAITAASLTANLQFALDAADPTSTGTATKWLDTSGNGQDFFLGTTIAAEGTDPTLNVGGYFTFDGGDLMMYDTTNETWMQNCHKNAATFSFLMAMYLGNIGADQTFVCTSDEPGGSSQDGFMFGTDTPSNLNFRVVDNDGVAFSKLSANGTLVADTWAVFGLSISENAGATGGFFYKNGAYAQSGGADQWNPSYTSPASSNASNTFRIGGTATVSAPLSTDSRIGFIAAWSSALTKANFDAIYDQLKSRYGL